MIPNTPGREKSFWRRMSLLAAIAIFALVLPYPFCSDLSIYQWMALQLVHHGALPYVGSWDDNFPGILLFHSLSILLFGNSELGFRAVEAGFQVVTAVILYQLLSHWLKPRTAFFAVLFYGLGATSWGVYYLGQRDVFAAGLLIWSLAAWRAYRTQVRWLVLSGLLFGWCILIRPTYLLPALTVLILDWQRLRTRAILFFLTASSLPVVFSTIPYFFTGTFDQYYDSTILYNLSVYQSFHNPTRELGSRLADAFRLDGFAVLALLPAWLIPRVPLPGGEPRWRKQEKAIYIVLLLEVLLLFIAQRKYLSYQLAPFLALLSPLAAAGLERGLAIVRSQTLRSGIAAFMLVSLFVAYSPLLPVLQAETTKDLSSLLPFANSPNIGLKVEHAVASYLARPDNAEGAIEIVAFDARLRAQLERQEATRFTMAQALALTNKDGTQPAFQREWRKEFITKIAQTPARFLIIGGQWEFWTLPPLGPNLSSILPELDSLLRVNYIRDTTIGTYAIYRMKSDYRTKSQ